MTSAWTFDGPLAQRPSAGTGTDDAYSSSKDEHVRERLRAGQAPVQVHDVHVRRVLRLHVQLLRGGEIAGRLRRGRVAKLGRDDRVGVAAVVEGDEHIRVDPRSQIGPFEVGIGEVTALDQQQPHAACTERLEQTTQFEIRSQVHGGRPVRVLHETLTQIDGDLGYERQPIRDERQNVVHERRVVDGQRAVRLQRTVIERFAAKQAGEQIVHRPRLRV